MPQITTTERMKLRFHNLANPESRKRAPTSEAPARRAARLSPVSPWCTLTLICCTMSTHNQVARSISSSEIGIKSIDTTLDSTSLAKKINHTHGASTAVPAIDGESRWMANHDKPTHTTPWETSKRRPLPSASPAGINNVKRTTITVPPIHRTWSETEVWFRRSAAAVSTAVTAA